MIQALEQHNVLLRIALTAIMLRPDFYDKMLQPSSAHPARTMLTGQVEQNGLAKYVGQYPSRKKFSFDVP